MGWPQVQARCGEIWRVTREGEREAQPQGEQERDEEIRGERLGVVPPVWFPPLPTRTSTLRNGERKRHGEGVNGERGNKGQKGKCIARAQDTDGAPHPPVQNLRGCQKLQ